MTHQTTHATIVQMRPLTDSIFQLILAPEHYIDYQAGQYLKLMLGDTAFCYSIANAPLGTRQYELHIRHSHDAKRLFDDMKQQDIVHLQAPFGHCDVSHLDPQKPILFIAAGTGFSQIHAMIEQLLASGGTRRFELIWSARNQSDLYLDEKVKQWQNRVHRFQYISLIPNLHQETPARVVLSRHASSLHDWQMVLSGPFDMVYSTRDQLVAHGVSVKHLYSDAFQFEEQSHK